MIRAKKVFTVFSAIAVMLFCVQLLPAQSIVKPYYQFKTYTTDDGLCNNGVNCVYKDSRGFLWIGTGRGLQRFNGSSFLTFRHFNADSNSITHENIVSITEDKQHDIWICTMDGIAKFSYSNGKLTNYRYGYKDGSQINVGYVCCFFEDSYGRQWIGTVKAGLFLFDKVKRKFIHYPPAPYFGMREGLFRGVAKMAETGNREIVFNVVDGIVIMDSAGRQQYIPVPPPADRKIVYLPCNLMPLIKNHPEEIWIASSFNGLFKYNRVTKEWGHYKYEKPTDALGSVVSWNTDEWMCCYKFGAYLFNHRSGIFIKAFDCDKILPISQVYRDNVGNIWLPSNQNGLHKLAVSNQLFSSMQYIKRWFFDKMLYYDSNRQILYGMSPYHTDAMMYFNFSTNTVKRDSIPGSVRYQHVINDFIADDNILYIARWGGMCQYNLSTRKLDSIVYKNGSFNSTKEVFSDVCKSSKKIYFAGGWGSGGPYMYDKLTHAITDLALLSAKHAALHEHSLNLFFYDGILYSGMTYGDSIYCYNERTGKKNSIPIPAEYLNGTHDGIQSFCVDKKENLWCGTISNGIYVYNIPSRKWVKYISQEHGVFFSSDPQLVCDDDGNVWCNGSGGLYLFNNNNFLFKNYNINDGLGSENGGGSLVLLSDHQLAFNNTIDNTASFGIINTKKLDDAIQNIPLSITDLKVLGNPFLTDTLLDNVQAVIFPPNQNAFSLSYAGIAVGAGKNLLYSYVLEGIEKRWHEVGNEQSLSYVNLAPGNYTLHIKFKSRDERIIGNERLLYIKMLPAWYQTWWFKLLSSLAISSLLFFAFRYYFQQKIKKQQVAIEKERALNEERNRIAADLHDDVGAGLSRIRYITASMKDKQHINNHDIDKIVSLSDESVEKMNEIIWALNQGSQQLDELIYYLRSHCSEMVNNAGLVFDFQLPQTIPVRIIAWKDCRNIYLLVKEAVNNAIKHSFAKKVSIYIEMNGCLLIQVKDDGIGFNKDVLQKQSNGLLNYKKRVESLGGKYSLLSSPGNGTTLHFEIPLTQV